MLEAAVLIPDADNPGICTFEVNGDTSQARGSLDVGAGTPYQLVPVLQNNLVARGAANTNSSVEDSELQLTGEVDVRLNLPDSVREAMGPGFDGEALPLSYTLPIASNSMAPGELLAVPMPAIPAEYAIALQPAIGSGQLIESSVDIVFKATRTGNSVGKVGVIESREFRFPITLCDGCAVLSCTNCQADGTCEPGTEIYADVCGSAQDVLSRFDPDNCAAAPFDPTTGGGGDGGDGSTGLPPSPGTGEPTTG